MREIAPGLFHWSVPHPRIGAEVSSYYLRDARVVIDPMLPPEGLAWFADGPAPAHVVMTNRHHDRDAWRLRDAFGCTVHCPRAGLHELAGRGPAEGFDPGDLLPGGIEVHAVGAICPDESALHIPALRALAIADGIVRWPGADDLVFVPDALMDDPEGTKAGLRAAFGRLLDLEPELLLLAHGAPVVGGGRAALAEFLARA
jgi:hypothetical protein